jgi:UDP-N-acetylglucosamine 4,6-dehydratase
MSQLNGASVLITGGTGSLGKSLIKHLLTESNVRRVAVFSRDELKQHQTIHDCGGFWATYGTLIA